MLERSITYSHRNFCHNCCEARHGRGARRSTGIGSLSDPRCVARTNLPDMGEPTAETKIHKFFANPIVQGVGVFLALALAFSGKLSQVGTRVCIVLAACVGIWGLWSHLRSKLIAIVFTIAYIAALLFLAKFLTQSTVAVPAPPFITVKISPSAFPVSVAPRSTLYIFPLIRIRYSPTLKATATCMSSITRAARNICGLGKATSQQTAMKKCDGSK